MIEGGMEQKERLRIELPVVDRSNYKDFVKSGVALASIVLWSVLTVENNSQDKLPAQVPPMPAPPAYIRD